MKKSEVGRTQQNQNITRICEHVTAVWSRGWNVCNIEQESLHLPHLDLEHRRISLKNRLNAIFACLWHASDSSASHTVFCKCYPKSETTGWRNIIVPVFKFNATEFINYSALELGNNYSSIQWISFLDDIITEYGSLKVFWHRGCFKFLWRLILAFY